MLEKFTSDIAMICYNKWIDVFYHTEGSPKYRQFDFLTIFREIYYVMAACLDAAG